MKHWAQDAIFYHIYPLGLCGAPPSNDFSSPPVPRLEKLHGWLDHIQNLGVNAIYLGPVFESTRHGYDTIDYYHVDRRLGTDQTLTQFVRAVHSRGMRLVLDSVFNHVGRNFWAFYDVRQNLQNSPYCSWFDGLDFSYPSPKGDPFTYEGWSGHYSLVKLNLQNPEVRDHLLGAVRQWIEEFEIDGLRLDAADCVDLGFQRELADFCKNLKPDFWLMGEIVAGDYRIWGNPETLDSVTNYECYKGLYSSHNDHNYFEIAYALNRQFSAGGIYQDMTLYSFADNHDVSRVASILDNPAHLYPLYSLLFTMPGVPSVYYGSEWGIKGDKTSNGDAFLRPALDLAESIQTAPQPDLPVVIKRLAEIRHSSTALRYGNYTQLHVSNEQFAFARQTPEETIITVVNAADQPAALNLQIPACSSGKLTDLLNPGESFQIENGHAQIDSVPPCWARILKVA